MPKSTFWRMVMGIFADTWVLVGALFVAFFWLHGISWRRAGVITKAVKDLEDKVGGHLHGLAHTSVRTEEVITDIQLTVTEWRKEWRNPP